MSELPGPESGPPPSPNDAPGDPAPGPRLGDYTERPLPRGCHPLVFGVVMATVQLAITIYFMQRC